MKKRKLAESITKESEKKDEVPQGYKRLCTPPEGAEDPPAINLVVEDTEEEHLKEYRFEVTPKMVEERVKTMKDYLLEIAGVPPSEDTPLLTWSAIKPGYCLEDTTSITRILKLTISAPTHFLITSLP